MKLRPTHYIFIYSTTVLSVLFNFVFLLIVRKFSGKTMGNYKYLLMIFASFDIFYSVAHALLIPVYHEYNGCLIMFVSAMPYLPLEFRRLLTALMTALFLQSIILLLLHFVYRYFQVCKSYALQIFHSKRGICSLIIIDLVILAQYVFVMAFFYHASPEKSDFFRHVVHHHFEENVDNVPYLGLVYVEGSHGNSTSINYHTKDIIGVVISACNILIPLIMMFLCGICIYREIGELTVTSQHRQKQAQLFRTLQIQTMIPFIFTFLPYFITIIGPIVPIPKAELVHFMAMSFCVYPVLDPLVIMFFVRSYRHGLQHCMRKGFFTSTAEYSTSHFNTEIKSNGNEEKKSEVYVVKNTTLGPELPAIDSASP